MCVCVCQTMLAWWVCVCEFGRERLRDGHPIIVTSPLLLPKVLDIFSCLLHIFFFSPYTINFRKSISKLSESRASSLLTEKDSAPTLSLICVCVCVCVCGCVCVWGCVCVGWWWAVWW